MIKLEISLWFYSEPKPFADVSGTWAHYYSPSPYVREPGVPPPTPAVIPPDFPPVVPNSDQRPGEDINLLHETDGWKAETAATETPPVEEALP